MEFTMMRIRMVCWIRRGRADRRLLEVRPLVACPFAFLRLALVAFHPLVAFRLVAFLQLSRKHLQ